MNGLIYLDNQATTPCDPRVLDAMLPWFTEKPGNSHSIEHAAGRAAEAAVDDARAEIAALIGADAREIVLTSGATEANNLAIKGAARFAATQNSARRRVVTVVTEHKCVVESALELRHESFEPVVLPVGPDGMLDLDRLTEALRTPTLLVSVMAAHNEIGVLQDIAAIARIAHAAGALVHTDAAQAAGKIAIDVGAWDVDLLSISAHKFYGPKGVGALYVRRRPRARILPLFSGGAQERGMRSGTLPTPLLVGFGTAAALAAAGMAAEAPHIAQLRERFWVGLHALVPGLVLNGHATRRLPGNLNITFPNSTAAELMARTPELCLSTGSACSSASIEPSYVLTALGIDPARAARTLRIGIGRFTSAAEIDHAVAALAAASFHHSDINAHG